MTLLQAPQLTAGWAGALNAEQSALLLTLDRFLQTWAADLNAIELVSPVLVPIADLQGLDYYENFPHQAVVATQLAAHEGQFAKPEEGRLDRRSLRGAHAALLPAACYSIYLRLAGTQLPDPTYYTTLGRCCRAESTYEPLARQLGFHMREIVAVGDRAFAQDHVDALSGRILALGEHLGLRLEKVAATDPFFDGDSSKAQFAKLFPVKYEFIHEYLAIGSINTHRTYFGDKLNITSGPDGGTVSTSCVAFGLERWVWALQRAGITPQELDSRCTADQ
jgi:hypothetical protein